MNKQRPPRREDRARPEASGFPDPALLQAALDSGGLGFWEYDHVARDFQWSDEVAGLLDCGSASHDGGGFQVGIHPLDHARLVEALEAAAPLRGFAIRLRPDNGGPWRWVGCSGRVIEQSAEHRPLRSGGTLSRTSREATRHAICAPPSDHLRLVTDRIAGVFYIADAAIERMFYVSPAYEQIWGRPLEELYREPRSFLDAVHPEDRAAVEAALQTHMEGRLLDIEYRIIRPDGSIRWIWDRGFPVAAAAAAMARAVGVAQDITRRKLAESDARRLNAELQQRIALRAVELDAATRALRDTEARYRTIVESAQEGIWMIDGEARTTFVNPRMAELLGYTSAEMLGRPLFDFMHPEWQHVARKNLQRRADGIAEQHEFQFRRKNGTTLWGLISTNPLFDGEGQYAGALAMIVDIGERKKTEALNRKLAAIIEASSDLIATATPDGRIDYINRAGRALLGIKPTESLSHAEIGDYHTAPAYRRIIEEGLPAALNFGRWLGDNTLLTRGGAEIPVSQLILAQLHGETGQLEFISTICRDITDKKRAEEALLRLQQEQELILDTVPAMIFYKDTTNRILRVNALVAQSLGRPKDEIEGRHTAECFPEEAERYFQDDLIVIESGLPRLGIEEPIQVAPGEKRWFSTDKIPLKDDRGRVTGVLVMAIDITERKRAEISLRQSREDLAHAQAVGRIGSWRLELPANTVAWSSEAYRIFGISNDVPLDYAGFLSLVYPEDRETVDRTWQAALRGEAYQIEHRILAGDQLKWVSEKAELDFDESGHPTGAFGTVQDITERKLGEEALLEAHRRKDQFLATLAHELRNPLAPIGSAVKILQQQASDESIRTWCCDVIARQVGHLTQLVDDLLDVSRITRGKINLDWKPIPVAEIAQCALETSRPLIDARGHELTLSLPAEPAYVEGDRVRLTQILSNLLNNAAKYTDVGGTIELRIERSGDEIAFHVKDTGIGIPADALPHVFDMFSQLDHSLDRTEGGLGIGLSLARELARLHRGTIAAHSKGDGLGSEFIVRLPAVATPPGEPGAGAPLGDKVPVSHRILVVDDNRDAGDSLAALLTLDGHEVYVARDGLEAVEAAEAHCPEFILMDIGMPRMNGYEACRRIREQAWAREIPITALTGWGQDDDRRRADEAGFTHHLTKPVDIARLRRLIDALPSGAVDAR